MIGRLSGCHSSVVQHWQLGTGVLDLIPDDCWPFICSNFLITGKCFSFQLREEFLSN